MASSTMVLDGMLPKWLTEEDPAAKYPRTVYCRKHNFWYWPSEGCSCCAAEAKGLLPPPTKRYPPRY